ncbi:hypothetical protein [Arthrobacter globiformis]|uniref:Uncharacterized protein n=1 Tax=Arthrobacter globiformis TaxID=1665 RepID=A0A328HF70_ARTGO|nr:hypothetical protein [Arthrobacter globiformis]RAM37298.1 hypothetical protein DBZ45_10805 [Arthrobacter globiformis]
MSELGGTKTAGWAALIVGLLLGAGLSACTYEDDADSPPTVAGSSRRPAPSLPTKDPEVLAAETSNFAELKKRLAAAPGSVLLDDSGPADGPGVGFQKSATVKTSGAHAVTASCVGTDGVQIHIGQDPGTGSEPISLVFDCSETVSQVVDLQAGYVWVSLTRNDPTGPRTGAVAGVRITSG